MKEYINLGDKDFADSNNAPTLDSQMRVRVWAWLPGSLWVAHLACTAVNE